MAKVSLTKLGLKVNLISYVINSASDENNYSNPVKENVFLTL